MATTQCPGCGHNNGLEESLQGALGDRAQLRCRCCGAWWSIPVSELPFDEEVYDEE
jgi:transcription elongation factor Elf1